jgi:hypothetical protein
MSPSEYLVLVEHEGEYWCEDSSGIHSNIYRRRKPRSQVQVPILRSVARQWNSGDKPTMADRWNTSHSNGQKPTDGPASSNGLDMTHYGALNLMTEKTALLIKHNFTCPAQTQKDENGVERYWPAIKLGRYHAVLNRIQMERLV